MKKIIILVVTLLSSLMISTGYALTLTSDANGSVTVSEPQLNVGELAPRVELTTPDFKKKVIGGATGKVQIISTIESCNTSVCDLQVMQLNAAAPKLKNTEISVVTANMPFVMDTFKTQHKINNINLLSAFHDDLFGKKYGLLVTEGELTGILARSIFVIGKDGKVIYKEIPQNIDKMPDLKAALAAAEKAQ